MFTRTHAAVLAALAVLSPAFGQITLVSAGRSISATPGDGSGSHTISSALTTEFNESVNRPFSGGFAQASAHSTANAWGLTNSMSATSAAPSQGQAGSANASYSFVFSSGTSFDAEFLVTATATTGAVGTVNFVLYNDVTNALIDQGSGSRYTNLPAGRYRVGQAINVTWGQVSATIDFKIHPGNDRCANAWTVQNGTTTSSTVHATPDGSSVCPDSDESNSVWYRYVAPAAGSLLVSTCGSDFDTVLTAYHATSCPTAADQVGCNDDVHPGQGLPCPNTRQSALRLLVTSGEVLYFRVAGYNGASGNVVFNVGPTNDYPWGAIPLTPGETEFFENVLATTDGPQLSDCTFGGQDFQVNGDLWYTFTATEPGKIDLSTYGSNFDTKLAVYSGGAWYQPMTYLACNDDAQGFSAARIDDLAVVPGPIYWIRVGGYRSARGGGEITLTFAPACPADFNGDGFLDFFDYDDYVSCFEGACPAGRTADFNNDGFADFFDYDDFVTAFEAGC